MKFYVAIFFALSCAVFAEADINDVRNAALKRIDHLVDIIKNLADETSTEVGKREGNIKIISKHTREFGDGILGKATFEVNKSAKSAYMMANLLQSKNDVFRCIETREREATAETEKTYNVQFLKPGQDYELKAEDQQRKIIKAWKDDYYKAIGQYGDIYKRAVSEVQKSNSESYISSIVKQFEDVSKQMADIITGVHTPMAKLHIDVLKTFDQLVARFQQYSRSRVDETAKKIQQCFPKLFQAENFLSKSIF